MARRGLWVSEGGTDLLEPIALDDLAGSIRAGSSTRDDHRSEPPPPARPPRPTWLAQAPWIAAGSILFLLLLAFPVRAGLTVGQLRKVEHQWLIAQALETDRGNVLRQMLPQVTPDDKPAAAQAQAAVDDQQAVALERVRHNVNQVFVIDPGLRRARSRFVAWLDIAIADRRRHTLDGPAFTQARLKAIKGVNGQLNRWGQQPAKLSASAKPPHMDGADRMLAQLSHYLDRPTGGLHLVGSNGLRFETIDIDRSTHTELAPDGYDPEDGGTDLVLRRDGYFAFLSGGVAYAMPLGVTGDATPLGNAVNLLPAVRPDAVWLIPGTTDGPVDIVEVDGSGHEIAGPFHVPGRPVGEVRTGLAIVPPRGQGLDIWDPVRRRTVRHITGTGDVLAVSPDTVAWVLFDGPNGDMRIHLTNTTTGADRGVSQPADVTVVGNAQFSPDGSQLASIVATRGLVNTQSLLLSVVDVKRATTSVVDGPLNPGGVNGITWSPAGDRVFVVTASTMPIATWAPGDARLQVLRLPIRRLLRLAVG